LIFSDIFRTFAFAMELKKAQQADLESKRTTFFLLGFTVVLAVLFVLLEWSSEETLPPRWEGLPAVIIENEYSEETPPLPPVEAEKAPVEASPPPVYEDYTVVEEAPEEPEAAPAPDTEATAPEEPVVEPSPVETPEVELPVAEADVMPQYPGGRLAMNRYLFAHLKYPASALSQRIEGRVWCSFVVNRDGSLSDVRVERGVYLSLDQEAVRALQAMPPWEPGRLGGKSVAVKVYLPIVFKL
jgi:protein TonB